MCPSCPPLNNPCMMCGTNHHTLNPDRTQKIHEVPFSRIPNAITGELARFHPESILILRVVSHALKRTVDSFLRHNREEIVRLCADPNLPLHYPVCCMRQSGQADLSLHLSLPATIRSFGIPVEKCPNNILFPHEIMPWNFEIQNVYLKKIWRCAREEILRRNPPLGEPPALNAPPQNIRNWLHKNLSVLRKLVELRLRDLDLAYAPTDINLCAGLQRLYLQNNRLVTLPEALFKGLNELQWLHLENNTMASLPERLFERLTRLRWLHLENNQLRSLPETLFHGLAGLERLHLQNNQLVTLPEKLFHGLAGLKVLDAGHNHLASLPERLFHQLPNLKWLCLRNNQLRSLSQNLFHASTRLRTLHLQFNQLDSLPEGLFQGLTHLKWLNLQNNQLTSLSESLVCGLNSLKELHLEGNPQCLISWHGLQPDEKSRDSHESFRQGFPNTKDRK